MFCTKCGSEFRDTDQFCPQCGFARHPAVAARNGELMLDKRNKKIAGVCAGFARYLGTDIALMRVLWLGVALCTGVGFLVYLAAWMILPSDYGEPVYKAIEQPRTV